MSEYSKKWRLKKLEEDPDHDRRMNLRMKYGITLEQFDLMLQSQGGICKICGGPPGGYRNVYVVDHCHKTKKIRGLLCNRCNVILGQSEENITLLKALIRYLELEGDV